MKKKLAILDNGYSSRKLILCLLLIIMAWIVGQYLAIEKLKVLLDFTEIMTGIYITGNVGTKFAFARSNIQTSSQPKPQTEAQED